MTNYYKIPRDSETGRKFEALFKKGDEIEERLIAMEKKYGYDGWFISGRNAYGGVVAVIFPNGKTKDGQEIDTQKTWKKGECGSNTYAPRARGAGAKIEKELNSCGRVTRFEFNELMGVNNPFHLIGYSQSDKFFGASMNKEKSKSIPPDAIEITGSEYYEIFDK